MAYLPCDYCGKITGTQGSWDAPITIICEPCYDKRETKNKTGLQAMKNLAINAYPVINGVYRHYKGGIYKVLFLSKHTETDEVMVNYKSLLFGSYHSRPLNKWLEKLDEEILKSIKKTNFEIFAETQTGISIIQRFQLIDDPKEYEPCM